LSFKTHFKTDLHIAHYKCLVTEVKYKSINVQLEKDRQNNQEHKRCGILSETYSQKNNDHSPQNPLD
jgi:hypothetical protein